MKLKIRELREEFGMTQKELASKIGNMQRNVSNWESGVSEPDCETVLKLANLFNVSIDELYGRDCGGLQSGADGEASVLRLYRRLSDGQKEAVKNLLLSFAV